MLCSCGLAERALAWPRGRTEAELSYSLAEAVAGSQLFRQAAARKSGAGAAAAAGFDRFDGSLLRGVRRLTSRNAVGPTNRGQRWTCPIGKTGTG